MIDVEVIETSSSGDHSYLATDGEVAMVVDQRRDVDRVLALAGRLGVRISHVVETHVHNDYGYRATAAASLLARAGRNVVVIDDNYGNADTAGIALSAPA